MSCANMNDVLPDAARERYAVGAFNILDYGSMRAVVEAAEELDAPVIIQTSVKTVLFWGYDAIAAWYRQLGEAVRIPAVLHLDHCKEVDVVRRCIAAGWTSVMIDASGKPFEENLAATQRVIEMARPAGITVEAELGEIGGVEDDISVKDSDARLADPEKAVRFCAEAKVDVFAPAIGTAHGIYKGEPKLAFDRLEQIARRTRVPIALHGGTGLSDEVFHRCIALGCAKVNISTMLKYSHIDGFVEYAKAHPEDYNPLNHLQAQRQRMKADVQRMMALFGSRNRAKKQKS